MYDMLTYQYMILGLREHVVQSNPWYHIMYLSEDKIFNRGIYVCALPTTNSLCVYAKKWRKI